MKKNIIIDSAYPEETRVAVECGGKLSEYDFITSTKQRNRGNIYLAKITRVEPSLQAAFVEYGEDKQGFLPFSEIHPDYYQIPEEDRAKILEEQQLAFAKANNEEDEIIKEAVEASETTEEIVESSENEATEEESDNSEDDAEDTDFYVDEDSEESDAELSTDETEESAESGDKIADKKTEERFVPIHKRYKIQEVVRKNQIVLIQVSKEERGNKGATLSSYITIAGRYCVLMVNTLVGGGVSRKIAKAEDRKRLKGIIESFNIPNGMSIIVRTAGNERSEEDLRSDYDYLVELWNSIREEALKSVAPALVHEESHLIKRSIRDLYDADVDKIIVQGDEGFSIAKKFMKMLMPASVKNVKAYKGKAPIFQHYKIEEQVSNMYQPNAGLKSGGYLVIQPTEALISIDVNSGRSISARNIEETALKTNLEAVDEVARQLKLRNLSGLVVIDFIDMMNYRHRRAVEKATKSAFKGDRAKIQIGRISPFGLMEMSRQRIGANLVESTTAPCSCCDGAGHTRSTESMALHLLRDIEAECSGNKKKDTVVAMASPAVANYLNNKKREKLASLEKDLNITILVEASASMKAEEFTIDAPSAKAPKGRPPRDNKKNPPRKPREASPKRENKPREKVEPKPDNVAAKEKFSEKKAVEKPKNEERISNVSSVSKAPVAKASPTKRKGIKSIRSWFATEKKDAE